MSTDGSDDESRIIREIDRAVPERGTMAYKQYKLDSRTWLIPALYAAAAIAVGLTFHGLRAESSRL